LLNWPAPQIEPYIAELLKFDLVIKKDKTCMIRDKILEHYLQIEADELNNRKIVLPK
jgi:hypothetical protein